MRNILVIAPHPDDETFGCGGVLLRHKRDGDSIHWLIMTRMDESVGFSPAQIRERENLVNQVATEYDFDSVHCAGFVTARLDDFPLREVIKQIGAVFRTVAPEIVYLPYPGDVHSDHRVVFDAASACTKWFRFDSVRRVLAYETLSETEFGINPCMSEFRPNVFVDIGEVFATKMSIIDMYGGEILPFPFPRSREGVRALAEFRGLSAGCRAAEAFVLLKEIL